MSRKRRVKVLYAEDNIRDADLARSYLEEVLPGVTVHIANSGKECLDALRKGGYFALLLDNHLPDTEGVELLRAVRESKLALPSVMVTGAGDEQLVVEALRAGAWDYVPKAGDHLPVLAASLRRLIEELENSGEPRSGCKLLYLEPNQRDVDLTLEHLREHLPEVQLATCKTLNQALELLQRDKSVALIVAEMILPDGTALDLLARLQEQESDLPVLVLASRANEDKAAAALHLGAYDFFFKEGQYLPQMLPRLERLLAVAPGSRADTQVREVLYVEQSAADLELTASFFHEHSGQFRITGAQTVPEAIRLITESDRFSVLISDLNLRGASGIELLRQLRTLGRDIPSVVVTGRGTEEKAVAAMQLGACDYIVKREEYLQRLLDAVGNAFEQSQMKKREKALRRQLKEANSELRNKMILLRQTASDLNAFSYSVSHELKAPVRAIAGYARVVREDYQNQLPAEASELVARIENGAIRMSDLIDALLKFHRSGTDQVSAERVDLGPILRSIRDDLAAEQAGRSVEFEIGELPVVLGDPAMLRQAFFNLIANAYKFTRLRPAARVQVGLARQTDRHAVIFVRDNGVGFQQQDLEKVFGLFETVHSRETYEGTGVGLPIVRRIVERHGGTVWAEGAPNQGATFFLELPAA